MNHKLKSIKPNYNKQGETLLTVDVSPSWFMSQLGFKTSEMQFLGKGDNWSAYSLQYGKVHRSDEATCKFLNLLIENNKL